MRPVIAVLCGTSQSGGDRPQPRDCANRVYSDVIRRVGGAPVLIPLTQDEDSVRATIATAAGLLITGGVDIDPAVYGEARLPECGEIDPLRDATDRWAIAEAQKRGMPILAICRGIQSLAAFLGGTLYQDIPSQVEDALAHRQKAPRDEATHRVGVAAGSLLAGIVGAGPFPVNSFHHQAARDVPPGFCVSGRAPDGVIEAIEASSGPFRLGVQWHPEEMTEADTRHLGLFEGFVSAARHPGRHDTTE